MPRDSSIRVPLPIYLLKTALRWQTPHRTARGTFKATARVQQPTGTYASLSDYVSLAVRVYG